MHAAAPRMSGARRRYPHCSPFYAHHRPRVRACVPLPQVIKEGDLCLFDMGTEFSCYGADVTTTFPASGKFSADQRMVYEAVFGEETQHAESEAH